MSSVKGQRQRILPPYTRQVNDFQHRALKTLGIAAMVLVAIVCGYALALFGTYGWFIPAIPVAVLAGVALWMAPDIEANLTKPITKLLFLYLGIILLWPNYIALNLPGLPWISFARLALLPFSIIALYAISTSYNVRSEIADRFRSNKIFARLFIGWIIWQFVMQVVGGFSSPGRWVNNISAYYLACVVVAWLFIQPEFPIRFKRLVNIAVLITSAITIWEFSLGSVPWAGSIPSFLSLDPEVLDTLNSSQVRTGQYRAVSIFMTAVAYGEFIGIMLPFVVLTVIQSKGPMRKTLAILMLVLLFIAAYFNNSRTAMVAFVVVPSAFVSMWVWKRFRRPAGKQDLLASAMAYVLPFILLCVAAMVLTIGRIRVRVLGGNAHAASNEGREAQWDMALPVIAKNPFGYGMGTVSQHVPYTNRGGVFTLDSYPINLLVEVGVPGFLLFVGMFACALVMGVLVYLRAETESEEVAGAAALSILSFLITRLVLSSETGHQFVYPMMGIILALWYVQKKREPVPVPEAPMVPRFQYPARLKASSPLSSHRSETASRG